MVTIAFLTDFSEEYARNLLKGISRYSYEKKQAWRQYRFPLSIRDTYGIDGVIDWARMVRADAIIGQFYNIDKVEKFRENGIIAIAQDFKKRFDNIPNITGDHIFAGRMGADYFIRRGFSNFAFFGTRDIVWSEERCEGFGQKVRETNPDFTFSVFMSNTQNLLWYYNTEKMVSWLKRLPKPVAIMASDDNQANHIIEASHQIAAADKCRIPYDIAVLGVDNDETICSLSSPSISSIDQGVEQGGYDTAHLIDRMIENPDMEWKDIVVVPTHIVTRQSTEIYATTNPIIAQVLRYIHGNLTGRLPVDDLVRQVPLSRRLLEIRFREEMHTSICDYIARTRIDKMVQYLNEGMNVSEAALELGFDDVKNVSRIFKRIKGITPSEYIRRMKYKIERRNG